MLNYSDLALEFNIFNDLKQIKKIIKKIKIKFNLFFFFYILNLTNSIKNIELSLNFACKIIPEIYEGKYIIFIDEASYNMESKNSMDEQKKDSEFAFPIILKA